MLSKNRHHCAQLKWFSSRTLFLVTKRLSTNDLTSSLENLWQQYCGSDVEQSLNVDGA